MAILTVGIDLAKNVLALHGVNEAGKPEVLQPRVPRTKLHAMVAALPPCTIGIEACSSAHHWARLFLARGHTVRLIAPKLVSPYRMSGKRGKNDAADAAAICEAVSRPNMRFVPVKTVEQQSRLMVHRAREGYVQQRTATLNRIRGLLSEFGIVLPLKAEVVRREAFSHLEDLPGYANTVIGDLLSEVHHLDERIKQYDRHIRAMATDCTAAQQLMQLTGVGETTATAIVAMVGNAHEFDSGRQFAAWIGLVPGAVQLGRQEPARAHHQGWRCLPAQSAGAGCPGGAQCSCRQDRCAEPLGDGIAPAPRLLEGGGGHRGEECAHGLGRAQQGRVVQAAGLSCADEHRPCMPGFGLASIRRTALTRTVSTTA